MRHCFSGKLICASCGEPLKRQITQRLDGPHPYWICRRHLKSAASCPAEKVWEEEVENRFATLFNKLLFGRRQILLPLWEAQSKREILDRLTSLAAEQADLARDFSAGSLEPAAFQYHRAVLSQRTQELRNQDRRQAPGSYSELDALCRELARRSSVDRFHAEDFTRFVKSVTVDSPRQLCFHLYCGLDLIEALAAPEEQEGR